MPIPTIASRPDRLRMIASTEAPGAATLADAVLSGLGVVAKSLPCEYFYDAEGSRLFEEICELPEYYPTRTEDAILRDHADVMVAGWRRAPVMVELGSGSSSKTRRLIAAALGRYRRLHYVPIDVSPTILEDSAEALVEQFAGLRVTAIAGDYRAALGQLASRIRRPKLVVFLGSSLGNFADRDAVALLRHAAGAMGPDGRLLLGTDLVKAPAVLEAAYDDARGVTAAFNRNLLRRINVELGADFDLDGFAHLATFRADLARVEMHLVSRSDQVVRIPGAGMTVRFVEGEAIHTENSHKYTEASLASIARRAGFVEERAWTDARGWFRVQRWRPRPAGV